MTIFQENLTKFDRKFIEIDATTMLNYAYRTKTIDVWTESEDDEENLIKKVSKKRG